MPNKCTEQATRVETRTKFWMVYGSGKAAPTKRHTSKESAMAEANRLAKKHPGTEFFVLKAVRGAMADSPTVATIDLVKPRPDVFSTYNPWLRTRTDWTVI